MSALALFAWFQLCLACFATSLVMAIGAKSSVKAHSLEARFSAHYAASWALLNSHTSSISANAAAAAAAQSTANAALTPGGNFTGTWKSVNIPGTRLSFLNLLGQMSDAGACNTASLVDVGNHVNTIRNSLRNQGFMA